ncbi:MAG: response regulator transcription factor [Patescibacteria group bacterium]|jgi:DNA-binding response OmpR family regulator
MRILLVEDEPDVAAFVIRALKNAGYSVDTTPSAEQGVFLGKTNEYDVIILDVMLPDGEGFDVCREIRTVKKKVPILMLTVKSEVKDKIKAFDLGADDYLIKPFALEELIARLHALLRRPQVVIEEVYHFGDIVVDTKKGIATKAGQIIDFRTKEFALLEYLLRNRGIVLTRSMLLEHVWDMNIDPFTNTVDVHIRSVRRKLGDEEGKIIETVHGKGYRINA